MSPQRQTPASLRRQAEGTTGVGIAEPSVPGWAQKRRPETLLRFGGVYLTPDELRAQVAADAATWRVTGGGGSPRGNQFDGAAPERQTPTGGLGASESPATHPVDRLSPVDLATGEILLPCRSLETTASKGAETGGPKAAPAGLTGPHRKVASALSWNVAHLCSKYGVDRVGFLTLTFADHVTDVREASRRFHSLKSNVLAKRYPHHIRVLERQKNGRIHYHLLVVVDADIRTGADFNEFAKGKGHYGSANASLRLEWAFWRKTAPVYRFGRTELMPIRSDAAALGQYVGKYIGKHLGQREERDKGARLVSYSGDARMATSKFARVEKYSTEWRAKVLTFSRIVQGWKPHARIRNMDDLALALNDKRWAYNWRDFILALPPADLSVPF